jgi:hypothetical protein
MIFLPPKDNKKPARNRIFKDWWEVSPCCLT